MELARIQRVSRRAERARHVRDLLRKEILSGVHGWNLLPSEMELTVRFAASRNAVREALDFLRQEGIVARVPGAGTFVVRAKAVHRTSRLQGIAESQENGHRRVGIEIIDVELFPAPEVVATKLQIEPGSDIVFLERRLRLDNEPLSVWSSYLPSDLAGELVTGEVSPSLDFYELMERGLGMQLGTAELVTEATLADTALADILEVAPGAPILLVERLLRRCDGRPVEFGFVHMRGDRIQFHSLLTRPEREEAS
jgi:GntR family transcriptional regulator